MDILLKKIHYKKSNKSSIVLIKKENKKKKLNIYKKTLFKIKKLKIHDEFNLCSKNNFVVLIRIKPHSKSKFWKIIKFV